MSSGEQAAAAAAGSSRRETGENFAAILSTSESGEVEGLERVRRGFCDGVA